MPPRCHVDRCISQEARGGGTTRNPFPTHIAALAMATTAAEVLDAKNKAGFAYTTATAAARFAEAKNAHDA